MSVRSRRRRPLGPQNARDGPPGRGQGKEAAVTATVAPLVVGYDPRRPSRLADEQPLLKTATIRRSSTRSQRSMTSQGSLRDDDAPAPDPPTSSRTPSGSARPRSRPKKQKNRDQDRAIKEEGRLVQVRLTKSSPRLSRRSPSTSPCPKRPRGRPATPGDRPAGRRRLEYFRRHGAEAAHRHLSRVREPCSKEVAGSHYHYYWCGSRLHYCRWSTRRRPARRGPRRSWRS